MAAHLAGLTSILPLIALSRSIAEAPGALRKLTDTSVWREQVVSLLAAARAVVVRAARRRLCRSAQGRRLPELLRDRLPLAVRITASDARPEVHLR